MQKKQEEINNFQKEKLISIVKENSKKQKEFDQIAKKIKEKDEMISKQKNEIESLNKAMNEYQNKNKNLIDDFDIKIYKQELL